MAYPIDPITELAATKAIMHFKAAQCDELRAENAKLRELVEELFEDQCADSDHWKYRDRMRELGIEVCDD